MFEMILSELILSELLSQNDYSHFTDSKYAVSYYIVYLGDRI